MDHKHSSFSLEPSNVKELKRQLRLQAQTMRNQVVTMATAIPEVSEPKAEPKARQLVARKPVVAVESSRPKRFVMPSPCVNALKPCKLPY